jgi:hypothetical protein
MIRPVDIARTVTGTALTVAPGRTVRLVPGVGGGPEYSIVGRLLGVRYLVQVGATAAAQRPWVRAAGVAVDLAHAASMLALAACSPRHRRPAIASGTAAAAFAAADLRSLTAHDPAQRAEVRR